MQDTFEWPRPEGDADETIIRNIRGRGCHIVGIPSDAEGSGYAFSIGLFLNYDQAEVVIFGLNSAVSATIINGLRERAAYGQRYCAGDVCSDILIGSKICFVDVPLQAYGKYLGTAIWFYRSLSRPFPCLQVVWPDRGGRFPWDTGYDARFKSFQPLLASIS